MNNKIIDNDIKGKQNQQFDILTVRNNIPYVMPKNRLCATDVTPKITPTLFRIPTNSVSMVDNLLTVSDLTDLKLIYGMLSGFSYERIGEFCFLSSEAVKYRVRKIVKSLSLSSKGEAVEFISKYVNKDNLLHVIEEESRKRIN